MYFILSLLVTSHSLVEGNTADLLQNFYTKINQEYVQLLGMAEKKEHTIAKDIKKEFNRINSRFEFQAGHPI